MTKQEIIKILNENRELIEKGDFEEFLKYLSYKDYFTFEKILEDSNINIFNEKHLSKEAEAFLKSHPEYRSNISNFEKEFKVISSLKNNFRLVNWIEDEITIPAYEEEKKLRYNYWATIYCEDWDKPTTMTDVEYTEEFDDVLNKKYLKLKLTLTYEGIAEDEYENEYDVKALVYVDIIIPEEDNKDFIIVIEDIDYIR